MLQRSAFEAVMLLPTGAVPMAARSYPQQAPSSQTSQAYLPPSSEIQRSNSAPRSRPSEGWRSSTPAPPATISRGGSGSYAGAGAGPDYISQGPPQNDAPVDSFGPGSGAPQHAAGGAAGGGQAAGHAQQSQQRSGEGNQDWIRYVTCLCGHTTTGCCHAGQISQIKLLEELT